MQILTILVIEDEDSLLQLYRIVLEKEGFKVLTVHNGQEAWDLIENEHVDLVITDILMPVMDGYEFTKLLRHSNPGMPVLMITAKDDFPSKNKGFSLGTDDYMTKPVNLEEELSDEIMITGITSVIWLRFIKPSTSNPSISGIIISNRIRSMSVIPC